MSFFFFLTNFIEIHAALFDYTSADVLNICNSKYRRPALVTEQSSNCNQIFHFQSKRLIFVWCCFHHMLLVFTNILHHMT